MAVDKNFVVKNGIEVNSNLIFADANSKRVGIGSTGPRFTLDVRGGIAATDGHFSGIITAQNVNVANYGILNGTGANVSGIATFTGGISANQLSVSGLSTLTHLESTNVRVSGITTLATADITTLSNYPNFTGGVTVAGIATAAALNISGVSTLPTANITTLPNYPNFTGGVTVAGIVTATAVSTSGVSTLATANITTLNNYPNFTGGVTVAGIATAAALNISGVSTLPTANITTLPNYPNFTGGVTVSGVVTASSFTGNLTGNVGGNVTGNVTGELIGAAVTTGAYGAHVSGVVTATEFHGDGSNITGISTLNITNYSAGGGGLGGDANINTTGIITAGAFFTTGIITAANFVGSGEGLTGVASTDNIQTATDATFLANVNISGITTLANTNISGITTATNKIEVRSDDGSEGRIDFYCEVSNAHYTRIQAAPHASYAGNATVVLPNSSGTLLLTDGSGASLTNLNGSNIASGTISAARVATLNQDTTGNAATATALETARTIGGVSFDGTANINLPGVNQAGTQDTSGNATTATSATTATNATNITLAAESSDTTCFPVFATAATGNQAPKTSSNLTYDSVDEILSCTDFNTTSDINLKKDIEIITNANEILNQINGVNFTWIKSNKPSIGIIAQEIEKVLPQLVNERTDTGTKSVNYNGLIGVLIEAVKELSQRVEELERR